MPAPRKLHDEYFLRAKAEGYVARSAYKLLEVQERHRLVRVGDRVLDLGCAPGSWMQVCSKLVGAKGIVVGVDLSRVAADLGKNCVTEVGDVFAVPRERLLALGGDRPYDAVLSDMAPSTTGHGDDFLSVRLCRRVLELLPGLLRPGGSLAMKVLEGEEYPALLKETKALFREAKGLKPKASRDVSREMFIVGEGYRGGGTAGSGPASPGR